MLHSTSFPRRRRHASAVLALALLTGCGSTVQQRDGLQGGTAGAGSDLGGSGLPGGAGEVTPTDGTGGVLNPGSTGSPSGTSPGTGAGTGTTSAQGSTAQGTSGQGTSGQAPGVTGSTSTVGPAAGFGFTATKAFVGVEYVDGGDAFLSSAGYGSLTTGDAVALVKAMAKDINAKGGVLGRQVVPVFQKTDAATGTSNPGTTAQAACANFTQDNKVFAAVIASPAQNCLAKSKVMSMYFANDVDDTELNLTAPYTRRPAAYSFTHLSPLLIDRLVAEKYLTTASKVGILWPQESSGAGKRIAANLRSLLTKRGFTVAQDYGYDYSSAAAAAGSAPNAVLPFRSAGVDRVISVDASVAYFMTTAEQQGYRPRYALNSNLNLASVMESVPPYQQLIGSVGVGWQPINDVAPSHLDVAPSGFATCKKYIADSGQKATGSALTILTEYCDSVRLALYAAQSGGGFDRDSLRRGLATKGTAYPSAVVQQAGFSDTRMDGAGGARDVGYFEDCRCFKYLSRTVYRN